tara:strand:- start:737 stop:1108 length:372 start_codon:yes stop_codon:yes gene_type:complete
MKNNNDDNLFNTFQDVFESIVGSVSDESYPKEALPLGTFARSIRYDRLGVITDAYYGDIDKNGKKIIIYTLFLFPSTNLIANSHKNPEQYYLCNEYEYDVIAYLMLPPLNLKTLTTTFGVSYT